MPLAQPSKAAASLRADTLRMDAVGYCVQIMEEKAAQQSCGQLEVTAPKSPAAAATAAAARPDAPKRRGGRRGASSVLCQVRAPAALRVHPTTHSTGCCAHA